MKTLKIFLSIAGFAFTSLCFGQLFSQNNSDVLFYTAYYNLSGNSMDHHIDPVPARSISGDYFEAPFINRTYFVPLEYDIRVETWMTLPFDCNYYEAEIQIESWMEAPFESSYYEENLEVEDWMTRPFVLDEQIHEELEEEIEVEDWMKTPWI